MQALRLWALPPKSSNPDLSAERSGYWPQLKSDYEKQLADSDTSTVSDRGTSAETGTPIGWITQRMAVRIHGPKLPTNFLSKRRAAPRRWSEHLTTRGWGWAQFAGSVSSAPLQVDRFSTELCYKDIPPMARRHSWPESILRITDHRTRRLWFHNVCPTKLVRRPS